MENTAYVCDVLNIFISMYSIYVVQYISAIYLCIFHSILPMESGAQGNSEKKWKIPIFQMESNTRYFQS